MNIIQLWLCGFLLVALSGRRLPANVPDRKPHPVIVVDLDDSTAMLLGGRSGGRWIEQDLMGKKLAGRERYRLYSLTGLVGESVGERPKNGVDPPDKDQFYVHLSGRLPSGPLTGIAANWNAQPRAPRVERGSVHTYEPIVRTFLQGKGIRSPVVRILQIVRVDLEGDGMDEVLIAASNLTNPPSSRAKDGDYAVILLRHIGPHGVETHLLEGEMHPRADREEEFSAPAISSIRAILDLDGDGKMEVLIDWRHYEGNGTTAYQINRGKPKVVLAAGIEV